MKIKCTVMLLAVLLVVSGIPAVAGAVTAADEISVLVDGKPIVFDVAPRIVNDRTLVPLRAIFEEMGAVVEWDAATRIVNATKGDTVVVLALNDTSPTINGEPVTIDQPAIIVDGRTLAPLRFVAEAFGGTVDWNEPTLTASILTGKAGAETPPDTPAKAPGGGLVVSGGAASGTAVSADIVGLWAYSHTNQENESGTEVSITISEFQYAPPHMEISADGGATIYFYESRIRGTLALTAPDTYALLNSVSESEGFEYDDDIDDYLRYDPESGLLQYVTVVGGVHHYFRQNLTP